MYRFLTGWTPKTLLFCACFVSLGLYGFHFLYHIIIPDERQKRNKPVPELRIPAGNRWYRKTEERKENGRKEVLEMV